MLPPHPRGAIRGRTGSRLRRTTDFTPRSSQSSRRLRRERRRSSAVRATVIDANHRRAVCRIHPWIRPAGVRGYYRWQAACRVLRLHHVWKVRQRPGRREARRLDRRPSDRWRSAAARPGHRGARSSRPRALSRPLGRAARVDPLPQRGNVDRASRSPTPGREAPTTPRACGGPIGAVARRRRSASHRPPSPRALTAGRLGSRAGQQIVQGVLAPGLTERDDRVARP